jgi:hypothetical protein
MVKGSDPRRAGPFLVLDKEEDEEEEEDKPQRTRRMHRGHRGRKKRIINSPLKYSSVFFPL